MTAGSRWDELARRSPNFGFRLPREPVLVGYRAAGRNRTLQSIRLRRTGHPRRGNFDIAWLRDPDAEDSGNLPSHGVIAQEILGELPATLNKFAAVAEAWKATKAARQEGTT